VPQQCEAEFSKSRVSSAIGSEWHALAGMLGRDLEGLESGALRVGGRAPTCTFLRVGGRAPTCTFLETGTHARRAWQRDADHTPVLGAPPAAGAVRGRVRAGKHACGCAVHPFRVLASSFAPQEVAVISNADARRDPEHEQPELRDRRSSPHVAKPAL